MTRQTGLSMRQNDRQKKESRNKCISSEETGRKKPVQKDGRNNGRDADGGRQNEC
jgi:hypothetical protein